jgi:hypothetical protein
LCICGQIGQCYSWGVVAVFFIDGYVWAGLAVCTLSMIAAFVFTFEIIVQRLLHFHTIVDELVEGSDRWNDVLTKARTAVVSVQSSVRITVDAAAIDANTKGKKKVQQLRMDANGSNGQRAGGSSIINGSHEPSIGTATPPSELPSSIAVSLPGVSIDAGGDGTAPVPSTVTLTLKPLPPIDDNKGDEVVVELTAEELRHEFVTSLRWEHTLAKRQAVYNYLNLYTSLPSLYV